MVIDPAGQAETQNPADAMCSIDDGVVVLGFDGAYLACLHAGTVEGTGGLVL